MVQTHCMGLRVTLVIILSCCGCFVSCESIGTDEARSVDPWGPCTPIGPHVFPETLIKNISLTGAQITLPGCDAFDRIGLVLFHSGFGVRATFVQRRATATHLLDL